MNTMKKLLFFAAASVMTVSTAFAGGDLSKTQATSIPVTAVGVLTTATLPPSTMP